MACSDDDEPTGSDEAAQESRAALAGGNRFETALPDAGNKVAFKLLTGDDERKLPRSSARPGDWSPFEPQSRPRAGAMVTIHDARSMTRHANGDH